MSKSADVSRRTSGGSLSRHPLPVQTQGPTTLALATPSKPRANQYTARPSIHHYQTEGSATGYRHEMTRHSSSTLLGGPGDFVAETPAVAGGRHRDFHSRSFGNTSFSRIASLSADQSGRTGGTLNTFDAQPEGDDLADFMVDTDEEDEGVLFSGRQRRRSSHSVRGPSVKRVVEDLPEVPETPFKAA